MDAIDRDPMTAQLDCQRLCHVYEGGNYFEGDDPSSLGFAKTPSILTNFEVSPPLYAGRA
jgi:hypothetical protein